MLRQRQQTSVLRRNRNAGTPTIWPRSAIPGSSAPSPATIRVETESAGALSVASGDLTNTAPALSPLADNGGPTWTHALPAGSG